MSELFAGKYLLKERLGVGGMAEVWLAELKGPQGFSRQLVIKRILPHLADDDNFITMFEDEARLAARLSHPHAVRVEEFAQAGDVWYLAMEYLDGGDLRQLTRAALTRDESVPFEVLAQMGGDVASALHHAHTLKSAHGQPLNMIHRDVSPHNILVTTQGQAKLVDFGIARAESNQVKTRTGMVKGKSGYMSPEQALGRSLDGRSDQFALAIVLYETAAQARIFQGENDLAIMRKVVACEIPPLISIEPNASLEFSEVLEQALQRAAEDRFADCDAFAQALYACLDSAGYRGGHQPVATWVQRMSAVEGKLAKLPSLDERKELSGVREEVTKISRSRSAMRSTSTSQRSHAAAGQLSRPSPAPTQQQNDSTSWVPLALAGGLLSLGLIAFLLTNQRTPTASTPQPEPIQEKQIPTPDTATTKALLLDETQPPSRVEPQTQPAIEVTPRKPKLSSRSSKKKATKRAVQNKPSAKARIKFFISKRAVLRWGKVYVDGRRLNGDNPEVQVTVGRHRICVEHPNNGDPRAFKQTYDVPAEGIRVSVNMDNMAVSGTCP